ncbi:MAG TPA: DUF4465 domain-containing protein [Bacteroidales bacterium]|nr:DUF4465 domain-containing protein [Bacteroidales bacterium]
MKKKFRLMNAAFMVAGLSFAFTACEPETDVKNGVITFEDVTLNANGYWNGSDRSGSLTKSMSDWGDSIYTYEGGFDSGIMTCRTTFNENKTYASTWWLGIACSNHTNMDSIGLANQYSVYAHSGANGSEKFALIGSDGASCSFRQPIILKSLMVNNSTYNYWALKEGKDGAGYVTKFKAGDYFNVTVTGFDSTHVQSGKVIIPLAEFRNGQSYICSDWTKISLESLGQVSTLTFSFDSSDKFGEWLNTPTYFCIDNIVYEEKK